MIAFLWGLGWHELLIVAGLALLVFGAKRLPTLGRGLGEGIVEFRKAFSGSAAGAQADATRPAKAKRT